MFFSWHHLLITLEMLLFLCRKNIRASFILYWAEANVASNESYLFLLVTMHLLKTFYFIFFKVKKIGQLVSFFGCVPRYFKLFFSSFSSFSSAALKESLWHYLLSKNYYPLFMFYAILGSLFDKICVADEQLHLNQASADKMNLDS